MPPELEINSTQGNCTLTGSLYFYLSPRYQLTGNSLRRQYKYFANIADHASGTWQRLSRPEQINYNLILIQIIYLIFYFIFKLNKMFEISFEAQKYWFWVYTYLGEVCLEFLHKYSSHIYKNQCFSGPYI